MLLKFTWIKVVGLSMKLHWNLKFKPPFRISERKNKAKSSKHNKGQSKEKQEKYKIHLELHRKKKDLEAMATVFIYH